MLKLLTQFAGTLLADALYFLYHECGCCGIRRFDVQRRQGTDIITGQPLRDSYGVLCNDCFHDLHMESPE